MDGLLGAVIILLFWLYISFYIVLRRRGDQCRARAAYRKGHDFGQTAPYGGARGAFVADHVAGGPDGHKRPVSPVTRDPAAARPGGS